MNTSISAVFAPNSLAFQYCGEPKESFLVVKIVSQDFDSDFVAQ